LNQNGLNPIEVINTAVGGWGPFQYAQYYEYYGNKFEADMVLVGFFVGNDAYDQTTKVEQLRTAVMGRRITREAAVGKFIRFKIFLYEHFHIARLVMNKETAVRVDVRRDNCQDFIELYLNIQRGRMRNHLERNKHQYNLAQNSVAQIRRIKALADAGNIPLVVLLIPDENQINPDLRDALLTKEQLINYDFEMPQSLLKELFEQNDIQVIDLLPAFLADERCLYMNDTHWTGDGQELAATMIYEKLIEDNLIPRKI